MKIKLFSWNVNGIRAIIKKGEFQRFFARFSPDILCIQETKAELGQVEIPAEISQNYNFWFNSAAKKGYSGTAIFARKNLSDLNPQNIFYDFPEKLAKKYHFADDIYGDPNLEGRILTAEFREFYLTNCYTPNSKRDLSRLGLREKKWDAATREYLAQIRENAQNSENSENSEKPKPVIFCGDLNVAHEEIDLANPEKNHKTHGFTDEERGGFSRILDAGMLDSFRFLHPDAREKYTWWSNFRNAREKNVGWRIDYFLVDENLAKNLKNAEILDAQTGSDHCPIEIELEF